jgi:hypothetical protein
MVLIVLEEAPSLKGNMTVFTVPAGAAEFEARP